MSDNVYISSRVRLARNLRDYPFPSRMSEGERSELIEKVKNAIEEIGEGLMFVGLDALSDTQIVAMVERHLISPEFADRSKKRALAVSKDESVSIMVGEEDHLRIQVIKPGLSLSEAYDIANRIETKLSKKLSFAFDSKLGYLTQCPTNLGTGMRASVMMHLCAMAETRGIQRIASNLSKLGFVIRGTYGEGSDAASALFQLSNQVTLGISEQTAIENIVSIAGKLAETENHTRQNLMESMEYQDKLSRSMGILLTARLISHNEAIRLLSNVRLGICEGLIDDVSLDTIDKLLIEIQPAGLMERQGRKLTPQERDKARAELIKKALR